MLAINNTHRDNTETNINIDLTIFDSIQSRTVYIAIFSESSPQLILILRLLYNLCLNEFFCIWSPVWADCPIKDLLNTVFLTKYTLDIFIEYTKQIFRTVECLEIPKILSIPVFSHNFSLKEAEILYFCNGY